MNPENVDDVSKNVGSWYDGIAKLDVLADAGAAYPAGTTVGCSEWGGGYTAVALGGVP